MSNFSKRYFNDIDIKDLIHKYKQYDCLWNYNSPHYKNKALKQEAWEDISDFFQKDVNEVKRKIKYLRSAYVSEKRKVDASMKSGSETPYKPSLFYYNELNFLDNIVVLRKIESDAECTNIEIESADVSQDTGDNEEFIHFENGDDYDYKETDINYKVTTFDESVLEPISNSPKLVNSRCRPTKRKITGDFKLNNSVPRRTETSVTYDNVQCKNLYISFGKTIALHLKQLPQEVAILAMSEIQTILTKTTLEHVRCLQNTDSHSESEYSCNELIEESFDYSS